jgi:hypothetical protein
MNMEEDGVYLDDLEWEYVDIGEEEEDVQYPIYNGDGPCLRPSALSHFKNSLDACRAAGGLTYKFVKQLTANSNAYPCTKVVNTKFFGKRWENTKVEEKFWTLGMIMKISLVQIRYSGIKEYFIPTRKVYLSSSKPVVVDAVNIDESVDGQLTYGWFIQIHAYLCLQLDVSDIDDKCHQLHVAIESLNSHAKKMFIPRQYLSFDEDGTPSKSRYNPLRR